MIIESYDELNKLNEAIDKLLNSILAVNCDTEEYAKMVDQLTRLTKVKDTIAASLLKAHESEIKEKEFEATHNLKKDEFKLKHTQAQNDLNQKLDESNLKREAHESDLKIKNLEFEEKQEKRDHPWRKISPETLVLIGANLAGIALIIGHEKLNVITSKALGFVGKSR